MFAWGNRRTIPCSPPNSSPTDAQGKETLHRTHCFLGLFTPQPLCGRAGRDSGQPTPGQPTPGQPTPRPVKGKAGSEAVPAAAQGKEQGARPGEPGSGSLGTTDVSKPQHQGLGKRQGSLLAANASFPSKAEGRTVACDGARLVLRQLKKKKQRKRQRVK